MAHKYFLSFLCLASTITLNKATNIVPLLLGGSLSLSGNSRSSSGGGTTPSEIPNDSNRGCSWDMCEKFVATSGNNRRPIELSSRQRLQVAEREDFIVRYSNSEAYWSNATEIAHSQPVVEITEEQEYEILLNYRNLFRRQDELPPVPRHGVARATGNQRETIAKRAQQYICPQETRWEDVMFALDSDGELCQVIQLSDNRQWVMTGKCIRETSIVVPNVVCTEEVSYVGVMVVDFTSAETQVKDIEVTHCVAKLVL